MLHPSHYIVPHGNPVQGDFNNGILWGKVTLAVGKKVPHMSQEDMNKGSGP